MALWPGDAMLSLARTRSCWIAIHHVGCGAARISEAAWLIVGRPPTPRSKANRRRTR